MLTVSLRAVLFVCFVGALACAQDSVINESFSNLNNWEPLNFPKIERHTIYSVESSSAGSYLKAVSSASASALIYRKTFNVYEYPKMKWSWKISNVYEKGDVTSKSGDDYPARVYVIFQYDPKKVSFTGRLKYSAAKLIYGKYPPLASLNYIWNSKKASKRMVDSPYTDRSKLIILEAGPGKAGQWDEEEVNILDDYRKAFGSEPPAAASIAVMDDSDNTGESSISYFKDIEVFR